MSYKRRDFLKVSTALASGLALTSVAGKLAGCAGTSRIGNSAQPFGIQLYTLRDDIPKDPKGILKQLSSFGYKQIESYEHPQQGMFWSMKNTEFKKYMDDLGMKIISSHTDMNKDFERKAAEAGAIGMNYLICPYLGPRKSMDEYKQAAQRFNECGEICRKNGLRFAYHNHDYSFKLQEGQYPQDVMMGIADPALVDFQMDIYWVVTAGQDPAQWFAKYPNRFRLGHVKDRTKGATDAANSTTLGTGSINYPEILNAAKKNGMNYFIVEQERYDGTTPIAAAQAGAAYMQKIKISG
ncbi:MAG TPA: sugar phosphate isomerase/epimerase [Flavisolibacter sp.]